MKKLFFALLAILLLSCTFKQPTTFSEEALNDIFLNLDKQPVKFKEILNKYKGKKVVITIWASWCGDCREAIPDEKKLQKENTDVIFLHLSLDRDIESWKLGIEKLGLKGEHYFMQSGWKGDFGSFLNLSWIPRYLVLSEKGDIEVFNVVKPNDKLIMESLKK